MTNLHDPANVSASALQGKSGVIILSTNASKSCMMFATFLKVRKVDSNYHWGRSAALLSVDAYTLKSDFDSHQGNLHAVALPPGQYYLATYLANPHYVAKTIPQAEISVSAGETVYLGEFFMPESCAPNGRAGFRDQSERDLTLLSSKNPDLASGKIVTRLPVFSTYAVGGPED